MNSKRIGFLGGILALTFFASSASAAFTLCQTVGSPVGAVALTGQPVTLTCPSFVVPPGFILTGVDLQLVNDAQGPSSQGSVITWTWNTFTGVPEAGTQVNQEVSPDAATFGPCSATAVRINATCPTILTYPENITAGNVFNAVSVQVSAAATAGGVDAGGGDSVRLFIQYDLTVAPTIPPCFDSPFQVKYAANLNVGESYVDIVNTGANGAPFNGPGVGGATGNICANVYAFDIGEELVSCCSCLITPNQVVSLRVNGDILAKPIHTFTGSSVTLKILATLAGNGGTGTNCSNSAGQATLANTVCGIAVWGTTIHNKVLIGPPASNSNGMTETPFTPSTLSNAEFASITNRCLNIIGNNSTFGVCPAAACSATSGALGGTKM
jgi:hypothetical protein